MVFESIIVSALNPILGKYIEDLDAGQLRVGILGGDIKLEHLKLKANILADLDLPISVHTGYLKKLVVKIPWKNLYTEPVVINIEGLYLLATPNSASEYDPAAEAASLLQTKKDAISRYEASRSPPLEAAVPSTPGFTEKLVTQIVKNVQIVINDIHVRYEDVVTDPDHPVSAGVTLNRLTFQTCDENWSPKIMADMSTQIYKLISMDSLALYCNAIDSETTLSHRGVGLEAVLAPMQKLIARTDYCPKGMKYLVKPITMTSHATIETRPELKEFKVPKVNLDISFREIAFTFHSTQFEQAVAFGSAVDQMMVAKEYKRYRPAANLRNNYSLLWRFAIEAIMEEHIKPKHRQWTWEFMSERIKLRKHYQSAWTRKLSRKNPSKELLAEIEVLESNPALDVFNIIIARQIATKEYEMTSKKKKGDEDKSWGSWMGGWFKNKEKEKSPSPEKTKQEGGVEAVMNNISAAWTPEEKAKLFQAIGYDETSDDVTSDRPLDYEEFVLKFKLSSFCLHLICDTAPKPYQLSKVILRETVSSLSVRTSNNGIRLSLDITDVHITGKGPIRCIDATSAEAVAASLVRPVDELTVQSKPLVAVVVQTKPLDQKADTVIRIEMCSFEVNMDIHTAEAAINFMEPMKNSTFTDRLEAAARDVKTNIKNASEIAMKEAIESHGFVKIDVLIKPSCVILAEKGVFDEKLHKMLVLQLGQLHLRSEHNGIDPSEAESLDFEQLKSRAYDRYTLDMESLQVMAANPGDPWRDRLKAGNSSMHVLPATSAQLQLGKCLLNTDPRLAKIQLSGKLPSLQLFVSPMVIKIIGEVIISIPLDKIQMSAMEPEQEEYPDTRDFGETRKKMLKRGFQSNLQPIEERPNSHKANLISAEHLLAVDAATTRRKISIMPKILDEDEDEVDEAATATEAPSSSLLEKKESLEEEVTDLEFEMEIVQLRLLYSNVLEVATPSLGVDVNKLGANFIMRTSGNTVNCHLGFVSLRCYPRSGNDKCVDLLQGPINKEEVNELISVSVVQANPKMPEFLSVYENTEIYIKGAFTDLIIFAHQEALLHLISEMTALTKLQESLAEKAKILNPESQKILSRSSSLSRSSLGRSMTSLSSAGSKMLSSRISFDHQRIWKKTEKVTPTRVRLQASVGKVELKLGGSTEALSQIQLDTFKADVMVKDDVIDVDASMSSFSISNTLPGIYKYFLRPWLRDDKCLLSVSFKLFPKNKEKDRRDMGLVDMALTVRMGQINVYILTKFMTRLLSWISKFQADHLEMLKESASQAANNAVITATEVAVENATDRIKLDITIDAPVVIIPTKSSSSHGFLLNMGCLEVKNSFHFGGKYKPEKSDGKNETDKTKHHYPIPAELDKMTIIIKDTECRRDKDLHLDSWCSKSKSSAMLHPTDMKIILSRNLSHWFHKVPQIEVEADLGNLDLQISDKDLLDVMKTLNENVKEGTADIMIESTAGSKGSTKNLSSEELLSEERKDEVRSQRQIDELESSLVDVADLKVGLKLKRVQLTLCKAITGDSEKTDVTTDLCRFSTDDLVMSMTQFRNETMEIEFRLRDINFFDCRESSREGVNRIVRRLVKNKSSDANDVVKFRYSNRETASKDQTITIALQHLHICLSLEFLVSLNNFLVGAVNNSAKHLESLQRLQQMNEVGDSKGSSTESRLRRVSKDVTDRAARNFSVVTASTSSRSPVTNSSAENDAAVVKMRVHLLQPEIVLIAQAKTVSSKAVLLHADIVVNFLQSSEKLNVSLELQDLALRHLKYNDVVSGNEKSGREVFKPCSVNVMLINPKKHGYKVDVFISKCMELDITPKLINTIFVAMDPLKNLETLNLSTSEKKKTLVPGDIWKKSKNQDKFWFLNEIEEAVEATELIDFPGKEFPPPELIHKDQFVMKASASLKISADSADSSIPLLIWHTQFNLNLRDFSCMKMNAELTLEGYYYNDTVSSWEPLIEPIMKNTQPVPWEVRVELATESPSKSPSDYTDSEIDDVDDIELVDVMQPRMSVTIFAEETLEVTISNALLHLVETLQNEFTQAASPEIPDEPTSPFVIKNFTDVSVSVKLTRDFINHEDLLLLGAGDSHLLYPSLDDDPTVLDVDKTGGRLRPRSLYENLSNSSNQGKKRLTVLMPKSGVDLTLDVEKPEYRVIPMASAKEIDALLGDAKSSIHEKFKSIVFRVFKPRPALTIMEIRSIASVTNHLPIAFDLLPFGLDSADDLPPLRVAPNSDISIPPALIHDDRLLFRLRPASTAGSRVGAYEAARHELGIRTVVRETSLLDADLTRKILTLVCRPTADANSFPIVVKVTITSRMAPVNNLEKEVIDLASSNCYVHVFRVELQPICILHNKLPISVEFKQKISDGGPFETIKPGSLVSIFAMEPSTPSQEERIHLRLPSFNGSAWEAFVPSVAFDDIYDETFPYEADEDGKTKTASLEWRVEGAVQSSSSFFICGLRISAEYADDEIPVASVFSKYWVVNHTEKKLSFNLPFKKTRSWVSGFLGNDPLPLPYKSDEDSMKKIQVAVEDSQFSTEFSVDAVGSTIKLECKDSKSHYNYELGFSISISTSAMCTILTFNAFYLVANKSPFELGIREVIDDTPDAPWMPVPANGGVIPFWPHPSNHDMRVQLSLVEEGVSTAIFVLLSDEDTLLGTPASKQTAGINVRTASSETATVLTLTEYEPGMAPARVINHTSKLIQLCQKGCSVTTLPPGENFLFSWRDPLARRQFTWRCGAHSGELALLKDQNMAFSSDLFLRCFLDGRQRTLLFCEDAAAIDRTVNVAELEKLDLEVTASLKGFGLSLVDSNPRREVAYMAVTSSIVSWEFQRRKSKRFKPFKPKDSLDLEIAYQKFLAMIQAKAMGVANIRSFHVNDRMEADFNFMYLSRPTKAKIRRNFNTAVWAQYRCSCHSVQLHLKVQNLQIDNQQKGCVFPVAFAPVPPPVSVKADEGTKPFVEVSLIVRLSDFSDLKHIKLCQVLVQEMHLKSDMAFIAGLTSLFDFQSDEEERKFTRDLDALRTLSIPASSEGETSYFDLLHLSPLKIHLSFSLSDESDNKSKSMIVSNPVFKGLTVMTDIQDVIFKLNYFEKQQRFLTIGQIVEEMTQHYTRQAIKQMYVLVFGLDFLGNPVGLVKDLGGGVKDLFYEPYQGAIQGPEEFVEGLAMGVRKGLGAAVGGVFGTAGKITGAAGKAFAILSLDEEYQRKRRLQQQKPPADLGEGLARGGKNFLKGVTEGISGVVLKPIQGAKDDGAVGFFKGVGKGLIGAVARPVSGSLDLVSTTAEGIKNQSNMKEEIRRVRPPRFIKSDGILRPYLRQEAEGLLLLQEIESGKYMATDKFIDNFPIGRDTNSTLLLTDRHLMLVTYKESLKQAKAQWAVKWSNFAMPPARTEHGIRFEFYDRKKATTVFSKKGNIVTEVRIPTEGADRLMEILLDQYEDINATSKIDESSFRTSEFDRSSRGSFSSRASSVSSKR